MNFLRSHFKEKLAETLKAVLPILGIVLPVSESIPIIDNTVDLWNLFL